MDRLSSDLQSFGLEIEGIPILDRQFQRVKYQGSKDKRGFYTGTTINDVIYCTYGTWDDRGNDKKYCSNGETQVNNSVFEKIAIERKIAQESGYKKASEKAQEIIAKSEFKSFHAYCERKKIKQPYCVMVNDENKLIIPIISPDSEYTSVQYISEEGEKKFLYGGRIRDCCHIIQGDNKTVYICEGWATGQSIHQVTGSRVLVAFSEVNLENIVRVAFNKYPESEIVLCADNDHKKDKNIGLERGKKIKEKYFNLSLKYPSGIEGTDFNDMLVEKGEQFLKDFLLETPKICTIEDLSQESGNKTTVFPCHLIEGKGLISKGLVGVSDWSGSDTIPYNLPVVLAHISSAIAGKIRYKNCHPSFLFIKLGDTGTGKTDSDDAIKEKISSDMKFMKKAVDSEGKPQLTNFFYGATDIASGAGFLRGIQKQPTELIMLDEVKYFFDRQNGFDSNSASKIKELLEISTSPGHQKVRPYSDSTKNITIEYPVLNLIGNAPIKTIFSSLTLSDMSSGLIPRFEFFCYDGKIKYRKQPQPYSDIGDYFIYKLHQLKTLEKPEGKFCLTQGLHGGAVDIGMTDEAWSYIDGLSIEIVDKSNSQDDDGIRGMILRQYHSIIKFALIHVGSTRQIEDIFNPIELIDLEWGKEMSDVLTDWKVNILAKNISAGQFDQKCQAFLDAAKSAILNNKKPSGKALISRRPILKELTPKQWDEVVKVLKAREQIIIKEEKKTYYYPINEKKS